MTQRAKWIGKTQDGAIAGWAGDGTCEIISHDNSIAGFGVGSEAKGPAIHVQFSVPGKYTAWVAPSELEPA